jgi:hypothetical protein
MKRAHTEKPAFSAPIFILGFLLMILAPTANAITKHLSMTGGNGQPLAKTTTITIKFPDGTKKKKDTDDKGILTFNFNKNGIYTLYDPAGNVIRTVSVAGSGVNTTVVTIAAVGAGGLLLLLAATGGDESNTNNPPAEETGDTTGDTTGDAGGDTGSGDTDTGGEEPPATEEGSLAGTYNVNATVASNPVPHPVLIQNLVLQLQIIGTALTIIQLSNNLNFPNQLTGTITNGSFTASANGTYSGIPTFFQLAGAITLIQLAFLINIGSDGSLPSEQAITYDANGSK